ncbi:unnamed protein product [Rotaria sp. Silwood2]|nr:unnamed protein product [Rotaria sp. Silwood2]CAF2771630.1 unnamed protein product [Rotaria sp. Silwood2]CAF3002889.1 unnamed protein product [Rotaria sp. Silwood2]CAF3199036.1 unnamed protein product [Rotaria sp. Silwood2]CAF4083392.1 unnamed protein product [Rotaria sp. Silwood2]
MSSSFIGSKIAIITKSQCRYVGTIIGIDSQASSILLGNVQCFGTENRGGNFSNNQIAGTIVPIMQFANSDIEDLKIVDEEQTVESQQQKSSSYSMPILSSPPPPPPPQKQSSIHDDPAVVSAVISSTSNKDLSISNRLAHDLHRLNLSDDQHSKNLSKTEESRLRTSSGELAPSWPLLSSSKWENNKSSSQQQSGNKSKFFDDFSLNTTEQLQSNRSQQRWPSNTHSTQTSRHQDNHFNEQEDDNNGLPVRQPFFSNDRNYSQHYQQQNRYQNGNIQQHQQRYFYNNRRTQMNNQPRRPGDGNNRETFNDNGNIYDDEFDFETNNRKFNKLTSEDEFKEQTELPNQFLHSKNDSNSTNDYEPIYDKKKSFFDHINLDDTSNVSGPMYNHFRNQDTFGNDRNQRQKYRGNFSGGYRRSNPNNYRQQQQRNDDFYYRQNDNGYHYRN